MVSLNNTIKVILFVASKDPAAHYGHFQYIGGDKTVPIGFYQWKLVFLSSHGPWKLAHDYHMCALKLTSSRGVFLIFFQKSPNFKHIFAFLGQFMAKNHDGNCTKQWFSIITYLKASQKSKDIAIWQNDRIGFVTPPDHCGLVI